MKRTQSTFILSFSIALFFAACIESTPQSGHDLVGQVDTGGASAPDALSNITPPSEPVCGDGQCNGLETPTDCIIDCPICGDQICSSGENATNCPGDCTGNTRPPSPTETCGDGHCGPGESQQICPNDCKTETPPPTFAPPDPDQSMKGHVDGVFEQATGWGVQGWSCHVGWGGSVDVELYLGGPAGMGTYLKSYLANNTQEVPVGEACGTLEGHHRFFIPLSDAEMNAYAGKAVFVYGISPVGSENALLSQSGNHLIPGATSTGNPPTEDCGACLGGASSCSEACQGIGYNDGFCKYPGSTDSSVCCECSNPGPGPTGGNTPFNLGDVIWLHTDVSGWPLTANLSSVHFNGSQICMNYDKANAWPITTIGADNVEIVANPWIFIQHNEQWYAATWEWLRPGQTCKSKSSVAGDHIKQAPFGPMDWVPTTGVTYYMMVSAPARMGQMTVAERSNIVEVVWP